MITVYDMKYLLMQQHKQNIINFITIDYNYEMFTLPIKKIKSLTPAKGE